DAPDGLDRRPDFRGRDDDNRRPMRLGGHTVYRIAWILLVREAASLAGAAGSLPGHLREATRPPVIRWRSAGVRRNTAWAVPAAAQICACASRSASRMQTGASACATGGTPPMA